jgi:hypothetical protein
VRRGLTSSAIALAVLLAAGGAACSGSPAAAPPPSPSTATPGATPPSPAASVSPRAMKTVCMDLDRLGTVLPPILDRLSGRTETKGQYGKDQVRLNRLSQALYDHASVFTSGTDPHEVFATANNLSVDVNKLLYGYFMFVSPDQVQPRDVTAVRTDLADIHQRIASGSLPCESAG